VVTRIPTLLKLDAASLLVMAGLDLHFPQKCADVDKIVAIFSTLSKRAYYKLSLSP
jgi:hypothetical protein